MKNDLLRKIPLDHPWRLFRTVCLIFRVIISSSPFDKNCLILHLLALVYLQGRQRIFRNTLRSSAFKCSNLGLLRCFHPGAPCSFCLQHAWASLRGSSLSVVSFVLLSHHLQQENQVILFEFNYHNHMHVFHDSRAYHDALQVIFCGIFWIHSKGEVGTRVKRSVFVSAALSTIIASLTFFTYAAEFGYLSVVLFGHQGFNHTSKLLGLAGMIAPCNIHNLKNMQ